MMGRAAYQSLELVRPEMESGEQTGKFDNLGVVTYLPIPVCSQLLVFARVILGFHEVIND